MSKIKINYLRDQPLKDILMEQMHLPCNGKGNCGKCKVKVTNGNPQNLTENEKKHLTEKEIENDIRLACCLNVVSDMEIELDLPSNTNANILHSYSRKYKYNPIFNKGYGIATDIGTTTIVMYLMDFVTGNVLNILSQVNEQKKFGADVISRINYTIENSNGTNVLQNTILNQLNNMIAEISQEIAKDKIFAIGLSGNTTMINLLLGYDTEFMAKSPFKPAFNESLTIQAQKIGLCLQNATTYIPTGISAFIGGDIVSGVIDCEIHKRPSYSMIVDIGTNGEILIGNDKELFSCSTSAGPAFEGGQIQCGIGGVEGAISRVSKVGTMLNIETVGKKPPIGICGSGILDIIFLLLKEGLIDKYGYMKEENYYLTPNIFVSQKDIREIQMAKAAIAAGIKTLIHETGICANDIENFYLCGGFGNFMNIKSAVGIGLIPEEFKDRIIYAGNSSGSGCIRILSDKSSFSQIEDIKSKTTTVELSSNSFFFEKYVEEMNYPNIQ